MGNDTFLILAINPGSTSTKFAVYRNEQEIFSKTLRHSDEELLPFADKPILAQVDFRYNSISKLLGERNFDLNQLSAIAGRGGLLKPLASGTYRINSQMLSDLKTAKRGEHASNMGAFLAKRFAALSNIPAFIVDPVCVDEWPPVARFSGLAGLDRECLSHALNTKAICKRFAKEQHKPYAELNLIVAHLGSGFSISAHRNGQMIDVTNSKEEGAFSSERAGSLPVSKLIDLCFSGNFSKKEIQKKIFGRGGFYSYLQTNNLSEVLQKFEQGDEKTKLVFNALIYQIAKEIGAMATVLNGKADAILLTGGFIHSREVIAAIKKKINWIAPTHTYPGEDELRALAEGVLRVLRNEELALKYC